MRKFAIILAVVLTALCMTSSAAAAQSRQLSQQIHKGASGMTWLSNPVHAKFGTKHSRTRAVNHAYRILMDGLKSVGFYNGAVCIHGYEGSWTSDSNPTYKGGMQMDSGFQYSYGSAYIRLWGAANQWPVWAQLHASYKAWTTRGWHPWPNTARYCNLL